MTSAKPFQTMAQPSAKSGPPRPRVGLLVVGLGTLLAPLDTAVNIAFPSITRAFDLSLEDIRWVVIAYVLTYASLMLACGRLGDLVGYRPVFQLGLLTSAFGLLTCALAPNYGLLLVGRVLQGVGIALTLSCGPALVTSLLPESERTRALAFYAGVIAIGGALGPILGGVLVARWGWSTVFWFRLPLALLALALSPRIAAAPTLASMRGFDGRGGILLVLWMSALLLAFAYLPGPFAAAVPLSLLLLAAVGFAAFCWHERRSPQPLIRLSLFADLSFALLNAINIVANFAAFGVLILVPYYLLRISGLSAAAGGVVLATGAIGTVVGSWCAGRLSRRLPIGSLALCGLVLTVAGLWAISTWTQASPFGVVAASLFVQGMGIGLFQVGYSDYVTGALPVQERGVAGSLTMVTRTIGVVLGATGLSATFTHVEAVARLSQASPSEAFLLAFQTTFGSVALGLALVLGLSLSTPRTWRLGAGGGAAAP
jgi:EmrB/QacA subfamily drug resistance transporter